MWFDSNPWDPLARAAARLAKLIKSAALPHSTDIARSARGELDSDRTMVSEKQLLGGSAFPSKGQFRDIPEPPPETARCHFTVPESYEFRVRTDPESRPVPSSLAESLVSRNTAYRLGRPPPAAALPPQPRLQERARCRGQLARLAGHLVQLTVPASTRAASRTGCPDRRTRWTWRTQDQRAPSRTGCLPRKSRRRGKSCVSNRSPAGVSTSSPRGTVVAETYAPTEGIGSSPRTTVRSIRRRYFRSSNQVAECIRVRLSQITRSPTSHLWAMAFAGSVIRS